MADLRVLSSARSNACASVSGGQQTLSKRLLPRLHCIFALLLQYVITYEGNLQRLCSSLVISHLNYCNSILAGLPKSSLRPLEQALKRAGRLVYRARRSCQITPFLPKHQRLPVEKRIEHKIETLACMAGNCIAPSYLSC